MLRALVIALALLVSATPPGLAEESAAAPEAEAAEDASPEDHLLAAALAPWTGDFDGVVERGFVRIATSHSPFLIHYDGEEIDGVLVELVREFEAALAQRAGRRIDAVLMLLPRDQILDAVLNGRADIAAANLTVTPARAARVAFSKPLYTGVRELVATGPAAPAIASFDDLAAVGLYLRPSSSYREHLDALNAARAAEGRAAIPAIDVDERLEDHDLFEMVNAGILPAVAVDSHKATALVRVFPEVVVHDDIALHEGGVIAWATRPDAPNLLAAIDAFVATVRKGTLIGNILARRYFEDPDWIETIYSPEATARAKEARAFIDRYAAEYGFESLRIVAQGFQESRLDQRKRSHAGAVGVMQVLPSTARDPNVGIPEVHQIENNIHAGVKYLAFLRDRYFSDPAISPLDQTLFAFAAYNAGPGNVAKARRRAAKMGLDPNVWFENVEVAAAKVISREPYVYVRNIYKYYVAFALGDEAKRPAAAQ